MSRPQNEIQAERKRKRAEQYTAFKRRVNDKYFEGGRFMSESKRIAPVKIKCLHPDAVIQKYAHEGDAGFDLIAVEDAVIEPGATALIKTGLAFALPEGYEMQIRPRSGVTLRTKLRVQLGTVDAGYNGEVGVIVDNITDDPIGNTSRYLNFIDGTEIRQDEDILDGTYIIRKGDRIAQAVISEVPRVTFEEVAELDDTERGEGGFGSTGVKI